MARTTNPAKTRKPGVAAPFARDTLEAALVIPQAIKDFNAGRPFNRLLLADAIGRKPESSAFRSLLRSGNKYGLIDGSEKSELISLTELGRKAVAAQNAEDRQTAYVSAARVPELLERIYSHFNQNKLPNEEMAAKILQAQFGLAGELCALCWQVALENARFAGLVRTISGSERILLDHQAGLAGPVRDLEDGGGLDDTARVSTDSDELDVLEPTPQTQRDMPFCPAQQEARIFVAHSKNPKVLGQVKTMLQFAGMECDIAVETETAAIPVPVKVREAMRRCTAAVICVTADVSEGAAEPSINENVLIEIGAAFVLYGDRNVVLLWDKRIRNVPSNLQGLYRLEFEGDELSWDAGMRFMDAMAAIRSNGPESAD